MRVNARDRIKPKARLKVVRGRLGVLAGEDFGVLNAESDTLMTVSEVSEFLRLADSTVYRLAKSGELPARKVGGVWRFSRVALHNWIGESPASLDEPLDSDLSVEESG